MILHLNGLAFKAHSPSDLELLHFAGGEHDAVVRVRYNGCKWFIDFRSKVSNVQRIFNSRQAAIDLIASRVASVSE